MAIIGFAIWPDLPKIQSLNHTIKTIPMIYSTHDPYQALRSEDLNRHFFTFATS